MTQNDLTKDHDAAVGFFNLFTYLAQITEDGFLLNVMTVDDGACTGLTLLGIDKTSGMQSLWVEDEEGDKFIIFVKHIISITPVTAEEAEEDDEPGEEEFTEEDDEGEVFPGEA